MLGRFNAPNLLAALAVLLVSGIALEDAVRELARLNRLQAHAAPGRRGKPLVVVDYAHTPGRAGKRCSAFCAKLWGAKSWAARTS